MEVLIGIIFGGLMTGLIYHVHVQRRLNRAFWLWMGGNKQNVTKEEVDAKWEEFDKKAQGIITINKNE